MGIVLLDSNNVFFDEKIVLLEFLPAYKKMASIQNFRIDAIYFLY